MFETSGRYGKLMHTIDDVVVRRACSINVERAKPMSFRADNSTLYGTIHESFYNLTRIIFSFSAVLKPDFLNHYKESSAIKDGQIVRTSQACTWKLISVHSCQSLFMTAIIGVITDRTPLSIHVLTLLIAHHLRWGDADPHFSITNAGKPLSLNYTRCSEYGTTACWIKNSGATDSKFAQLALQFSNPKSAVWVFHAEGRGNKTCVQHGVCSKHSQAISVVYKARPGRQVERESQLSSIS